MTVRVLMRRKVAEEKLESLRELLDKMRQQAMDQAGYVSGETLKRIDTPGVRLVISKWKSLKEWQMWFDSPKRKAVQDQIDALLGESTDYEIYDYD